MLRISIMLDMFAIYVCVLAYAFHVSYVCDVYVRIVCMHVMSACMLDVLCMHSFMYYD